MKIWLLIFFFAGSKFIMAQPLSDEQLILSKADDRVPVLERKVSFGFTSNKQSLYNPVVFVAAGLMYAYQKIISPQLSATCGFSPSCSQMSKNLIAEFGMIKGVFCTADRLTRCNRICFVELESDEINPVDGKVHENTDRYK